jgi:hypothetical protein
MDIENLLRSIPDPSLEAMAKVRELAQTYTLDGGE